MKNDTRSMWRDLRGDSDARRAIIGYFMRLISLVAIGYLIAKSCNTATKCHRESKYPNTLQHDINSEWDCEPDNSKN